MKKGLHPESYRPVVFKDMSNGDMFLSKSTVATKETIEFEGETYPLLKIEISNTSHPFYTGKSTLVDAILAKVKEIYKNEEINDIDGVKIDFADKWVHLRKSNTEPIIRVYSEASTMEAAEEIGQKIMDVINELAKK